jgi:Flp pilus assembly protein TadG
VARWQRYLRRGRGPGRGQSLVEFALLLPVIALLVLGTTDLGRAFFAYQRLTNAVMQGGLFGVQYPGQVSGTCTASPCLNAYPYNIVYQVRQESAGSDGVPDANLTITVVASSSSDVLCYAGRSTTTLLTNGSFPGDCTKAATGDTIQIRGTYLFRPLTAQIAGITGATLRMHATVRMVIQ